MPRRRGRDRYRTHAQARRSTMFRVDVPMSTMNLSSTHVPAGLVMSCTHGKPWTACTDCSKPVTRRA